MFYRSGRADGTDRPPAEERLADRTNYAVLFKNQNVKNMAKSMVNEGEKSTAPP